VHLPPLLFNKKHLLLSIPMHPGGHGPLLLITTIHTGLAGGQAAAMEDIRIDLVMMEDPDLVEVPKVN
jgi:hypothetical protein